MTSPPSAPTAALVPAVGASAHGLPAESPARRALIAARHPKPASQATVNLDDPDDQQ